MNDFPFNEKPDPDTPTIPWKRAGQIGRMIACHLAYGRFERAQLTLDWAQREAETEPEKSHPGFADLCIEYSRLAGRSMRTPAADVHLSTFPTPPRGNRRLAPPQRQNQRPHCPENLMPRTQPPQNQNLEGPTNPRPQDSQSRLLKTCLRLAEIAERAYCFTAGTAQNIPPLPLGEGRGEGGSSGTAPAGADSSSRIAAIRVLQQFPATPERYFRSLLEIATGTTKTGRAEARSLLEDAPGVEEHVIALLEDSRQAARAGAAEWLAERQAMDAIPALKKRFAKEKSELAKAAILTTLKRLGVDLRDQFTPTLLLEEAERGLKKAKLDKLDWLALDHLPSLHFKDGSRVPDDVMKWWLFLAVKLKQPGGNALFDNYLEQLTADGAEQLSMWVLDSWVNYDTARPSDEDGNAYAKTNAKGHFDYLKRWYKEYTLERAFEDLKRQFMSEYPNSGAATKGLLGLAKRATPAVSADRVRHYLKNHGSRTSQSSALLEMLAAAGDAVSLQVIISAATRLKQKGVQNFAGTLVERVAEAKNWSMDELGDRTIPSAGLDEAGTLELPCGPDARMYTARLDESLLLVIRNPDGKVVKALPSGPDETTKASKKSLSASRKELKQVVAMQTARLYESLCSGRRWSLEDWKQDLYGHPVMRKLVERVVWTGFDESGVAVGSFRPTAEGDFTSEKDEDVDLSAVAGIGVAYGVEMDAATGKAWTAHLKDYEIKPLFAQFGRSLLTLPEDLAEATVIDDRRGWLTDTFTFRGNATKLGYERGEAMDAGYFSDYTKGFLSAGVVAVIEFSGNCLPEENVAAAMMTLSFEKYAAGRRSGKTLLLADVPPVLLSECWNDYRAIVAKATFDESWEQKMPWM